MKKIISEISQRAIKVELDNEEVEKILIDYAISNSLIEKDNIAKGNDNIDVTFDVSNDYVRGCTIRQLVNLNPPSQETIQSFGRMTELAQKHNMGY